MAEASRSDNSEIEIVIQSRSLRFRYEAGRRSSAPIIGKMNTTISTIQLNNIFIVLYIVRYICRTDFLGHRNELHYSPAHGVLLRRNKWKQKADRGQPKVNDNCITGIHQCEYSGKLNGMVCNL